MCASKGVHTGARAGGREAIKKVRAQEFTIACTALYTYEFEVGKKT